MLKIRQITCPGTVDKLENVTGASSSFLKIASLVTSYIRLLDIESFSDLEIFYIRAFNRLATVFNGKTVAR